MAGAFLLAGDAGICQAHIATLFRAAGSSCGRVRSADKSHAAKSLQTKEPEPLTMYERTVSTVRLPDGKLQLMSR